MTAVPPLPSDDRKAIAQLAAARGSISLSNKVNGYQHQHQRPFFDCCCCCCFCYARPTRATAPARSAPPPPLLLLLLLLLPQYGGIYLIHGLSCCRALRARRYEHEYECEFFWDDASSTTPCERQRTVAAGRRRPVDTIQRRSSALYSSYTSRASVLPAVVVLCTASSMVRGGMEDARCL